MSAMLLLLQIFGWVFGGIITAGGIFILALGAFYWASTKTHRKMKR